MAYPYTYPSTGGNEGTGLYDVTTFVTSADHAVDWTTWQSSCSCEYTGMHIWLRHWFRLLWTRRTW